jgi:adenylate cyclase
MAAYAYKRKLTVIFSADVAGYSGLMGEDEAATVQTLEAYKKVMFSMIEQHRGRVVDSPGDNLLADFASVVDAVQSSVAIQNELRSKNAEFPENRRMVFRIGINLGDVITEGGRIYGDGVNIAARLESLADPGGICISRTAYDQIESKLPLGYEFLGEQEVKNIARPVGVYRVVMDCKDPGVEKRQDQKSKSIRRRPILVGACLLLVFAVAGAGWYFGQHHPTPSLKAASIDRMAFPLLDKPSIAVLPFNNMSNDPNQNFFSDGLTDQIITTLSKSPDLFVIARNSTFTYKGRPVKVQQVAEELGVRYVLEGSVQKTANRVRINAQLIDAINGAHLWAERYDSDLKDLFDLQDEVIKKIISSLHIKLTYGEDARMLARYTDSLDAYLKVLEGRADTWRLNKDAMIFARQRFEEAIALDPNYVTAIVELACTHLFDAGYGWSDSRETSLEKANQLLQKALVINNSYAFIYTGMGSIYMQRGQLKEAIALRKKAVALEPNSSIAHGTLGIAYLFKRDTIDEAIAELRNANRLDPLASNYYSYFLGSAFRMKGEYEKAVEVFQKIINNDPNYWLSHLGLSICYGLLGQWEEARIAVAEVRRIDPNFSITNISTKKTLIPFMDKQDEDRSLETLRLAGLN